MDVLQLAPGLLAEVGHGSAEAGEHDTGFYIFFYVAIVLAILIASLAMARKGYSERVFKNPFSRAGEQLYLFLEQLAVGIIGPHGRKYLTLLATYWLFIFFSNVFGLFVDYTPTADFSLNLALSISAILYVQWEGIKTNGVFGHFKHFAGPKLTGVLVIVSAMIFIIELISETMKMLSLSLRLYGNIHGGHEVVVNLNNLGKFSLFGLDWNLAVGGALLPIKLLTCVVQAMVFVLLLCVYLGLVTNHEEEHEPGHAADMGHGVTELAQA